MYGLAYSHFVLCKKQVVHAGSNIHRRSHQENCCCLGGRPCPEDFGRGWYPSTGPYVGIYPILCEEPTFIKGSPLHGQAEPCAQGSTTHFESIYHQFSLCIGHGAEHRTAVRTNTGIPRSYKIPAKFSPCTVRYSTVRYFMSQTLYFQPHRGPLSKSLTHLPSLPSRDQYPTGYYLGRHT
jgi:hypothetical protein